MRLLDAALMLWKVQAIQAEVAVLEDKNDRFDGLAKLPAHLVTVEADAWNRFCQELQVDPYFILGDMPILSNLEEIVADARLLAFTPEEATAWLHGRFPDMVQAEVRTADHELEGMRKALEHWAGLWS
jgi:hypothetical protein